MAARLQMLQSKAAEASKLLAKKSCSSYKQTMEANKKYVVDPPTVEKCQELSKQLFYTRLARRGVEDHEIPLTSRSTIHNIDFQSSIYPAHYDSSCCLPGRYESFWKELDGVKHIWRNRHELKVEDAGIAALFGIELYAWFCVGEIAGRGFTLTGYYP